jgi:Fe2+ or Zn2+ uptake regulation protein
MTRYLSPQHQQLREALLALLAHGRAITTAELRTHLTDDRGFTDVTHETVYRHLDAMSRAGEVRRITHRGRRHIYWTRRRPAVSALHGQERR